VTHPLLVGILSLILATCSGWCTRLNGHDAGLGHGCSLAGEADDQHAHEAELPRPVNDDNCACAGALPQLVEAAPSPGSCGALPLPLDHPFALAIARPDLNAAGTSRADIWDRLEREHACSASLRSQRLRC
jgi:hypothetical protein